MDSVYCDRSPSRVWIGLCLSLGIALSGCGKNEQGLIESVHPQSKPSALEESVPDALGGRPSQVAALWEKAQPAVGRSWTEHAFQVVQTYGSALMAGSQDITQFCPSYHSLDSDQKASFWVYLVSAVAKYESNFDPTSRMRESGLGTDPVTHQHVYSEGLLQLSYQDAQAYPFCNEFDWSRDKLLSPSDPRKTILDPYKNLSCGIRILDRLVGKKRLIAFGSGNYWSTLMPGGAHSAVNSIKALTKQIAYCR